MKRIVARTLLLALLSCAAHAQILDRCELTPDMEYLLVETYKMADQGERWSQTRVVGPDWKAGYASWTIAEYASLGEGKKWFQLPDETPTYCEVNIQDVGKGGRRWSALTEMYIFALPKDRWWSHERNQGVEGYLLETEQDIDRWREMTETKLSVNVSQAAHSWLTAYYAQLETETLDELLADEGTPVSATAVEEDHYLAVATSPSAGTRIGKDSPGYFGIGWHTESPHDAGMTAVAECRKQGGGSACSFNASGTSLRGGCVGLAMARWRDRDKDPERAYVVASSSFRDLIARDLRGHCESRAFGGKYPETVVEQSCDVLRVVCSEGT